MPWLLAVLLSGLLPQLPSAFTRAARPATPDADLPRVYSPHHVRTAYPVWIDARNLLGADGKPDGRNYRDARDLRSLTQLLQTPPDDGCVAVKEVFLSVAEPPKRATIEEAVAGAELVLLGTVKGTAYGFSGTVPGQLLRIVPDQLLAGQAHTVSAYYAFVPVGTFLVGRTKVCKTDARYPEPPLPGEQVVLFVPRLGDPDSSEPFLDLFDDGGIVTIHSDAGVDLPARYKEPESGPPVRTKAELLARIRAAAAAPAAPNPS
ncbi:MAG TPA: hypothetical protein VGE98_14575 [Thermoanaerobaculia bacterium]